MTDCRFDELVEAWRRNHRASMRKTRRISLHEGGCFLGAISPDARKQVKAKLKGA
jgi:hypothetical protein